MRKPSPPEPFAAEELLTLLASTEDARDNTPEGDGYATFEELLAPLARLGWGRNRLHRALRALAAGGRVEVRRVRRLNVSGDYQPVPGYRIRQT